MAVKVKKSFLASMAIGCSLMAAWSFLDTDPIYGSRLRFLIQQPFATRGLALAPYDKTITDPALLPDWTKNIKNVWEPVEDTDTPLFWYIPKAGGYTLFDILWRCIFLTTASSRSPSNKNELYVKNWQAGYSALNVRTNSKWQINRAEKLDAVASGEADVYFSEFLNYFSEQLFNSTYQGRVFAMFRHPAKRNIDQFFYRQWNSKDRHFDPELAAMTIEEFAKSDKMIENFVTRQILGMKDSKQDIKAKDVELAKNIMREKILVGLFEPRWYESSVIRFERYFGWWEEFDIADNITVNNCHYKEINQNQHTGVHPQYRAEEDIFRLLTIRNWADTELYFYAKVLYHQQAKLLSEYSSLTTAFPTYNK